MYNTILVFCDFSYIIFSYYIDLYFRCWQFFLKIRSSLTLDKLRISISLEQRANIIWYLSISSRNLVSGTLGISLGYKILLSLE